MAALLIGGRSGPSVASTSERGRSTYTHTHTLTSQSTVSSFGFTAIIPRQSRAHTHTHTHVHTCCCYCSRNNDNQGERWPLPRLSANGTAAVFFRLHFFLFLRGFCLPLKLGTKPDWISSGAELGPSFLSEIVLCCIFSSCRSALFTKSCSVPFSYCCCTYSCCTHDTKPTSPFLFCSYVSLRNRIFCSFFLMWNWTNFFPFIQLHWMVYCFTFNSVTKKFEEQLNFFHFFQFFENLMVKHSHFIFALNCFKWFLECYWGDSWCELIDSESFFPLYSDYFVNDVWSSICCSPSILK